MNISKNIPADIRDKICELVETAKRLQTAETDLLEFELIVKFPLNSGTSIDNKLNLFIKKINQFKNESPNNK